MAVIGEPHASLLAAECWYYDWLADRIDALTAPDPGHGHAARLHMLLTRAAEAFSRQRRRAPGDLRGEFAEHWVRPVLEGAFLPVSDEWRDFWDTYNRSWDARERDAPPLAFEDYFVEAFERGRQLSREFYRRAGEQYGGIQRPAALRFAKGKPCDYATRKDELPVEITVTLRPDAYTLEEHVNLSFYFFHEFASHAHSARMSAERRAGAAAPFEDGWLLYAQEAFYRQMRLNVMPNSSSHRDWCLSRSINSRLNLGNDYGMVWRNEGYATASDLHTLMKACLKTDEPFWDMTVSVAATDYDALQAEWASVEPDFQRDFMLAANTYRRRNQRAYSAWEQRLLKSDGGESPGAAYAQLGERMRTWLPSNPHDAAGWMTFARSIPPLAEPPE